MFLANPSESASRCRKKIGVLLTVSALTMPLLFSGCGQEQKAPPQTATQVKAMKVIQRDTPLTSEYAGQAVGMNEVKVQSRVSGNVVEKYVQGGQFVSAGDPLYRIDSRTYEAALWQARANLAQSQANLNNAVVDLNRYQELLKSDAIEEQKVSTQQALVDSYAAVVGANEALVHKAEVDMADTMIYAPMTGQLSVDDVAVGTYAKSGDTKLVTIGNIDPIYVQFSIAETEYLRFMGVTDSDIAMGPINVTITLADGTEYPYSGQIAEADRALTNNTGSLTMKAIFPNPEGVLLPGMFTRVKLSGQMIPQALLVPQRAVQQLLGKSFVMVVGEGDKSVARTVTLGAKIGSFYIVKDGLTPQDTVIVEGLTTLREGMDLDVSFVTSKEMGFSMDENDKQYNPDAKK